MIETQKCIVGSILMEPDSIKEVYGILTPEHFTHVGLKKAFKAILMLHNKNEPVTLLSVSKIIEDDGEHSALETLKTCFELTVTSAQIRYHANLLIESYKRKRYRDIVNVMTNESVNDLICNTIAQLSDLVKDKVTNSQTLADIFRDEGYKYFNTKYDPGYLYVGYDHLDALIGGIENTDMVCIGARPSVGKSILVTDIALRVCKTKKVAFYNLEMNKKQVMDRIISSISGIEFDHVRKSKQFENEYEQQCFMNAVEEIKANKNLIINDEGSKTVADIKNECKFIDGLGLIIVDYLQLLKPSGNSGNRTQEVGSISRDLKAMAMDLKVPVIALSQLNRSLEYRSEKEPTLSDLREAGDIEQDCNIIVFLWNKDDDNKDIKGIKIAKNRQGSLGQMQMLFKGGQMRFYEIDDGKKYPTPEQKTQTKKKDGFMAMAGNEFEELPFKDTDTSQIDMLFE